MPPHLANTDGAVEEDTALDIALLVVFAELEIIRQVFLLFEVVIALLARLKQRKSNHINTNHERIKFSTSEKQKTYMYTYVLAV